MSTIIHTPCKVVMESKWSAFTQVLNIFEVLYIKTWLKHFYFTSPLSFLANSYFYSSTRFEREIYTHYCMFNDYCVTVISHVTKFYDIILFVFITWHIYVVYAKPYSHHNNALPRHVNYLGVSFPVWNVSWSGHKLVAIQRTNIRQCMCIDVDPHL